MNNGKDFHEPVPTAQAQCNRSEPASPLTALAEWRVWCHGGKPFFATTGTERKIRIHEIECYQPSTAKRRLARGGMRIATRLGIDDRLTRGVGELSGVSPGLLAAWAARVRSELATPSGGTAFGWPSRVERGRMYVYFLDNYGHQRAFAKLALSPGDKRSLEAEVRALRQLTDGFRHFRTPRLLADGTEQGLYYLLEEALPDAARHVPNSMRWYPDKAVREYAGKDVRIGFEEVSHSSWWQDYMASVSADFEFAAWVQAGIESKGLAVSRVHGNMTSMNVLRNRGTTWIIDWETYVAKGPVVVDRLSFYLAVYQRAVRRSPSVWLSKTLDRFATDGRGAVSSLDIGAALLFMAAYDIPEARALIGSWPRGEGLL